jgi:hypothetical protein
MTARENGATSGRTAQVTVDVCDLPDQVTHVWAPTEGILLVRADLSPVEMHHAIRDAVQHLLGPAARGRAADGQPVRVVPTHPAPLSA